MAVALCCFLIGLFSEGSALTVVTARPGDDVLLQCQVHGDRPVPLLEWTRPDLKEDGFVFFYRNQRLLESFQLPSYRGRVQLKDPELKDGDASVILRNATVSDTGTYQCLIVPSGSHHREIHSVVELQVETSGFSVGLDDLRRRWAEHVGVPLSVCGVLVLLGVCLCRKNFRRLRDLQGKIQTKTKEFLSPPRPESGSQH